MSDVGTPPPPPEHQPFFDRPPGSTSAKWPSGSQAAMLLGAGLVLGIGGCFAFLATLNTQVVSMIFGGVFFIGLILVLVGCLELVIIVVRRLINHFRDSNG